MIAPLPLVITLRTEAESNGLTGAYRFAYRVTGCPACGLSHFIEFGTPWQNPHDRWRLYATCPESGRPIPVGPIYNPAAEGKPFHLREGG